MKLIIVGILSAISFNAYLYMMFPGVMIPVYKGVRSLTQDSRVYHNDIHKMFKKMTKDLPKEYTYKLRLVILNSPTMNAWVAQDGQVTITTAFISFMNHDEGEIASVIGHEIAHYMLGHHGMDARNKELTLSPWKELMADDLGLMLALGSGYNACNGQRLWERLKEKYGDTMAPGSHPPHMYRAWNIKRLCKNVI